MVLAAVLSYLAYQWVFLPIVAHELESQTVVTTELSGPPAEPIESPAEGLEGDPVLVTDTELIVVETHPLRVSLQVSGELPTPCHRLRSEVLIRASEHIVEVSLVSQDTSARSCARVPEPFETTLGLGAWFDPGSWQVYLNGEPVGSFDV